MNSNLTTSEQRSDRHPAFGVGPQMYSNTEHEQRVASCMLWQKITHADFCSNLISKHPRVRNSWMTYGVYKPIHPTHPQKLPGRGDRCPIHGYIAPGPGHCFEQSGRCETNPRFIGSTEAGERRHQSDIRSTESGERRSQMTIMTCDKLKVFWAALGVEPATLRNDMPRASLILKLKKDVWWGVENWLKNAEVRDCHTCDRTEKLATKVVVKSIEESTWDEFTWLCFTKENQIIMFLPWTSQAKARPWRI